MSLAHRHELAAGQPVGPVGDALAEAEAGHISYLTRDGQPVAALVSMGDLAELQAVHDAIDIAEAEAIRGQPGPQIPHEVIEEMMDADTALHDAMAAALDARAGEALSTEAVRALWDSMRRPSNA